MNALQNKLSEKMKKSVHNFATYDVCEGKGENTEYFIDTKTSSIVDAL